MPARPFYAVETFQAQRSIGYLIKRLNNLIVPRAEAMVADADFTFSQWVVLTNNRQFLDSSHVRNLSTPWPETATAIVWTDDFSSLHQVLQK